MAAKLGRWRLTVCTFVKPRDSSLNARSIRRVRRAHRCSCIFGAHGDPSPLGAVVRVKKRTLPKTILKSFSELFGFENRDFRFAFWLELQLEPRFFLLEMPR